MDKFRNLMDSMINGQIIPKMRRESVAFSHFCQGTSLVGSSSVGLKVKSTNPEFDLDVIFKVDEKILKIVDLGQEMGKANFCRIQVDNQENQVNN